MLTHDIAEVSRRFVHFGSKCAGRNSCYQNAVFNQPCCEALGQIDDGRFGRLIAVGLPGVQAQAVNRGDVNHFGGLLGRGVGFEQVVHGLGEEEDGFHIQVHHLVPACFGEGLKRLTPGGAGVIDQNVDAVFVFRHGCRQCLAAFDCGNVLRHRNAVGSQLFGDRFADVSFAA